MMRLSAMESMMLIDALNRFDAAALVTGGNRLAHRLDRGPQLGAQAAVVGIEVYCLPCSLAG